jgi:hypothetical protein
MEGAVQFDAPFHWPAGQVCRDSYYSLKAALIAKVQNLFQ